MMLLMCSTVFGQIGGSYARIETIDGKTIEGKVINIAYGDSVVLEIPPSNTLTILWDDIREMNFIDKEVKERIQDETRVKPPKTYYPFTTNSWNFSLDLGFPFGLDSWGDPSLTPAVHVGVGYSFKENLQLGATLGHEAYFWPNNGYAPLGIEFRGRVDRDKIQPFYYVQTGYGFLTYSEYHFNNSSMVTGGLFANTGIGITAKRKHHRSWYLKLGWRRQYGYAEYEANVWQPSGSVPAKFEEQIQYNRIDLRLGWMWD